MPLNYILDATDIICQYVKLILIHLCLLTFTKMCIYTHVSSSSSETFVFSVWNMFVSFRVYVFLGQTKIYNVYDMLFFVRLPSDEEIFRLNISVYKVFGMDIFHSSDLKQKAEKYLKVVTAIFCNGSNHTYRQIFN